MKYGLSDELLEKIKEITKNKGYDFYIFGSRAKGTYHRTSDIDIAIFKDVCDKDRHKIMNEFDCLDTIYKIDLVFVSDNTKKELLDSILRDRKKI